MYCGALWFVFLAFVFRIFKVVDEVMDGNREIDKLTYENVIFLFRYIKAVECSVENANAVSNKSFKCGTIFQIFFVL